MRTARYLHAAILLPDGRVLAAGGTQWEQGPLGEAEVLDAAAGAWTAVSPLHAPRADAVATPLPDGRVLVTGIGPAAEGARLFGEVFDPAAGTWSLAPPLSSPRTGHTATVLPDGRILIAGGWSEVGVLKDCYLFVPGAALRGSGTTPVR
jgi:hypothetical protein